jgi:hypothetical protein
MITYEIERIPARRALKMVVANHYLHRSAPAMFAFGLFDGLDMVGCIIYGKPASRSLCIGVCGPEESDKVIELTRLWIEDGTPKNTESFLIGNSLKMLPPDYDIIVSYAEISAGHVGVVYQATNWLYTGMSDRHVEWRIDGESGKHGRHLFDEHGGIEQAKKFFGERIQRHERGRKHRYVMLRGNKSRKKELLSKLRYEIKPYPKAVDNSMESCG